MFPTVSDDNCSIRAEQIPTTSRAFAMAFQPIVKIETGNIYGYEALVRGAAGESPAHLFRALADNEIHEFDESCRSAAIQSASELGLPRSSASLCVNFIPSGLSRVRRLLQTTIAAAQQAKIPNDRLIFEITEMERISEQDLDTIIRAHREYGFRTAIDDFGAGYAGLNLLARFQPDIVKIDMDLVRNIHLRPAQQAIVLSIVRLCEDLCIEVIAEGVETQDEFEILMDLDISLFQGYFFAAPEVGRLPRVARSERYARR